MASLPAPIQPQMVGPQLVQPLSAVPLAIQPEAVQPCAEAPQGPVVQRVGNGEAFKLPPTLPSFGGASGQPLPGPMRQKMETFFGNSFADVRVHVGSQAPSIGALAFAHGSNLYFAPGHYNPSTARGQQLLGHELFHVVQQRAGRVRNPFGSGFAVVQDRDMEAEADRMGLFAQERMASPTADSQRRLPIGPHSASLATPVSARGFDFHPPRVVQSKFPNSVIQATFQDDVNEGWSAIDNADYYYEYVYDKIEGYTNKMVEIEGDLHETDIAEWMATGFRTWAENFYNKVQAYVYEAQKANDYTSVDRRRYAALGVSTDLEPDITVYHQDSKESSAVEVKASTSPNESAIYKLAVAGLIQLKKREDAGYNGALHLVVHNDNTSNFFPYTTAQTDAGELWNNIPSKADFDHQLIARISGKVQEQGFAGPLEIRLEQNGERYSSIRTTDSGATWSRT